MLRGRLTPLRIAWLVALAMVGLRLADDRFWFLHSIDQTGLDLRLRQRGAMQGSAEVVIVAVDDASIAALGRWPWSRRTVAQLVERINALDPAVIGFDIVWSEPTTPEEDGALAEALRASQRAVAGAFLYFDDEAPPETGRPRLSEYIERLVPPAGEKGRARVRRATAARGNIAPIAAAAREVGYFNSPGANDGKWRRFLLAARLGERYGLPLSLAMLRVYRDRAPVTIFIEEAGASEVRVGDVRIPVAENGELLINYRGPYGSFRYVSAVEVMNGSVPSDALRGKLVLVGVTAIAVGDLRPTPFDGALPGVEIHANILDNVLRGDFLRRPRRVVLVELPVMVFSCALLGWSMHRLRGVGAALAAVALAAAYLLLTQGVFLANGIPLTIVYPLLGIMLTYGGVSLHHYVTVEGEKRQTRRYLELYLSPWLARVLSEHPELIRPEGERRELTILFSDIRGFTTISEQLGPDVVPMLNAYLGAMTDVIFQEEGGVRYVGDAIMAWWNAPLDHPDHAERGCRSALGMVARLERMHEEWGKRGWPPFKIGIGLNTGPMVFGNLGSDNHLSPEIVGDHANLGARIEGLTKHYGCTIIASESTVRAAARVITCREIDCVQVKGRVEPVRIFEILGAAEERDRWALLIERFNAGLAAYRERRWEEAMAGFRSVLDLQPGDRPASLYIERCQAFLDAPPPLDWKAITVMETK